MWRPSDTQNSSSHIEKHLLPEILVFGRNMSRQNDHTDHRRQGNWGPTPTSRKKNLVVFPILATPNNTHLRSHKVNHLASRLLPTTFLQHSQNFSTIQRTGPDAQMSRTQSIESLSPCRKLLQRNVSICLHEKVDNLSQLETNQPHRIVLVLGLFHLHWHWHCRKSILLTT